ncbi:MAG TPA: hypothetical protein PKD26_05495 [Pyrinomonadaceae bacterium]|nr:hypothetical protein [Pyrinomonadaceae bacterium]
MLKGTKAFEPLRPSNSKKTVDPNSLAPKGGRDQRSTTTFSNRDSPKENEAAKAAEIEPNEQTQFSDDPSVFVTPAKAELTDAEEPVKSSWVPTNVHAFTFAGIFAFTAILYFRPYELIPGLSGFTSMALIAAAVTLLIYIPTQLSVMGNLTRMTVEIKCALFLVVSALVTMPLAKDLSLAWTEFSEVFIKTVIIFIVMINTLTSTARLKALMWLGIGVGLMFSYQSIELYQKGEFQTDGYRVSIDFGGMFGNPNDLSIHLVIFIPLAFVLGLASRNWIMKAVYFVASGLMIAAVIVSQSRGGFLGILALTALLAWKLGRSHRAKTMISTGVLLIGLLVFAPGNYGTRVASIFIPSLDPVGSSGARIEALERSMIVTLRNPLGIGIGNSPIVGLHELGTHNAYTQVSSELGWLAILAYLILLVYPIRRLDSVERELYRRNDHSLMYLLAIGLQASIAAYMVSSFFASVAYLWYVYYPIAFAIGLRHIFQNQENLALPASGDAETSIEQDVRNA